MKTARTSKSLQTLDLSDLEAVSGGAKWGTSSWWNQTRDWSESSGVEGLFLGASRGASSDGTASYELETDPYVSNQPSHYTQLPIAAE